MPRSLVTASVASDSSKRPPSAELRTPDAPAPPDPTVAEVVFEAPAPVDEAIRRGPTASVESSDRLPGVATPIDPEAPSPARGVMGGSTRSWASAGAMGIPGKAAGVGPRKGLRALVAAVTREGVPKLRSRWIVDGPSTAAAAEELID